MSDDKARDPVEVKTDASQPLFLHRQSLPERLPMTEQRLKMQMLAPAKEAARNTASSSWDSLWSTKLDHAAFLENGLFTDPGQSELAAYFDILRARLLTQIAANNWTRIGVTSPTPRCGKSFVAANLALSLARLPACRTLLIDLDLRAPRLAALFNRTDVPALSGYLLGHEPMDTQLQRVGQNLAVALNGTPEPRPYEVLQDPLTIQTLNDMHMRLQPDVTIVDLPPALESDDVLSMSPQLDAVLLVVDGTGTTPDDLRRCTRMLDGVISLAGVVLNKSQDRRLGRLRRHSRVGGR
jgi:protein-tyrosine kinase